MRKVYFLQREDRQGPIKIGCSDVPASRLKLIAEWSPYKLAIIAHAPGGFQEERSLHVAFDADRLHGEWFNPSPEILAYVARVEATGQLDLSDTDRVSLMAELYLAGATLAEIGKQFSLTRERVRQLLRKRGVQSLGHRRQHKRRPEKLTGREQEVAALYRQGFTMVEIAERLGDYAWNVNSTLRRLGVARRKSGVRPRADQSTRAAQIAELYVSGLKIAEIVEQIGAQPPTIYRYLRLAGHEPRRQRARAA